MGPDAVVDVVSYSSPADTGSAETPAPTLQVRSGDKMPLGNNSTLVTGGVGPVRTSGQISLMRIVGGATRTIETKTISPNADGTALYSFIVRHAASGTASYRLRYGPDLVSDAFSVRVTRQSKSLHVSFAAGSDIAAKQTSVSGAVRGARRPVLLQSAYGANSWHTVARTTAGSNGRFLLRYRVAHSGVLKYRVFAPATSGLPAAVSVTKTVRPSPAYDPRSIPGGEEPGGEDYKLTHPDARWNPCQDVGVRVRLGSQAPAAALDDSREAIRRTAAESGLPLVFRGTTDLVPQKGFGYGFGDYPEDTQVIIAWSTPEETDIYTDNEAGRGGAVPESGWVDSAGNQKYRFRQGAVWIRSDIGLRAGFGEGVTWGELIMHELGHAVGLQHAELRRQLMYPVAWGHPADTWGPGDRSGLALLGSKPGCLYPEFARSSSSPTPTRGFVITPAKVAARSTVVADYLPPTTR